MFNFIKEKLHKIYTGVTCQLQSLFSTPTIDQSTIQQLQELLLKADTGVTTTKKIITHLQDIYRTGTITKGAQLQEALEQELTSLLRTPQKTSQTQANVFLMVGINGSGKTTFTGKLAHYFKNQGKTCLIAAADTFRAAAPEQLNSWAEQTGAQLIIGKPQQDPASVVFDACAQFKQANSDILIIDTAGRLQNKENLMKELAKIKRIITTQLPHHTICTLMTVDAMLGQNSLQQARIFNEVTQLDGIVLTKMDGSAKGGIVFSIVQELKIPIMFICIGEHINDILPFDAQQYVQNLLGIATINSSKNS